MFPRPAAFVSSPAAPARYALGPVAVKLSLA